MICNQVTDWIYNTHGHKVTRWNNGILNPSLIATYADAVHSKGAALHNCFGFIDGTVRPISRPMSNQRVVYNGHKRVRPSIKGLRETEQSPTLIEGTGSAGEKSEEK